MSIIKLFISGFLKSVFEFGILRGYDFIEERGYSFMVELSRVFCLFLRFSIRITRLYLCGILWYTGGFEVFV